MNERKITVQEEAPGANKLKLVEPESKVDLQDVFILCGFCGLVGGTAAFSWRAAIILAGVLFFMAAYLIERAKRSHGSRKP